MKATEEILDAYRKQINADYEGEYLNRSERMLISKFNYSKVSVELKPLTDGTIKNVDFNGKIQFTEIIPQQYGGSKYVTRSFYMDMIEAKQSGCNFGSDRVEKKLLPYFDGKFESSGHFHPFYKEVSDVLETTLIHQPELRGKIWWSLLKDPNNGYYPTDFGLAVLVFNDTIDLHIQYNSFEWSTQLNWNEDLKVLHKETESRKICQN